MKFTLLSLLATTVAASSQVHQMVDIQADSELGMKLLSESRQLEGEGRELADVDVTWISGYSLKFQGCHHISQWNDNADAAEDVRVSTKRLVRFRLCPTSSCSVNKSAGCSSLYGDYILDMDTYLTYYVAALEANKQNESEEAFSLSNYLSCSQAGFNAAYFMGPYCSQQGGSIHLGVFTDDSCTTFADSTAGRETYYATVGSQLPYSSTNIITTDCVSCAEPSENNAYGDDASDSDSTIEMCEVIYNKAGKCEEHLTGTGTVYEQNNNACNYLEGIKIVRKDGTVMIAGARANKTASIFIGIFVVAFVLLSAYVYYLKTKLDRASINLAE